jgi:hypothetical protein
MKKYLLYSTLALTLLLSGIAHAELYSTSTNKINELKQKITNIKEKTREDQTKIKTKLASTTVIIKNVKEESKSSTETRTSKKLDSQKAKIADVFEKTIQNIKDLVLRTESRMSKMESANIDILSAKTLLETAKTKLANAETELVNLENLLAENLPSVSTSTSKDKTRKTMLTNIKLQSEKTKSSIKNAHECVVRVIASLKKGLMKNESTSTPVINSTSTQN